MKTYRIGVTYTPSVVDGHRLTVADMHAYVMEALEHIFERSRLTDLKVIEVEDYVVEVQLKESSLSSVGEMP